MVNLAYNISADRAPENPVGHVVDMHRVPQITLHAFCDTPEITRRIETAIADRRMSRAHAKSYPGGIAAAIDLYRKRTSPNLVIVESQESVPDLLAQLNALADVCVSGTKVIVIGYTNDVTIYRELLLRGVSEYIVAPFEPLSM